MKIYIVVGEWDMTADDVNYEIILATANKESAMAKMQEIASKGAVSYDRIFIEVWENEKVVSMIIPK